MFTNLTALYEDWNHVIVTAHRGASGCYPENTALAMRKAVAWGTDMIEFDLRTTLDGVPFILHDNSLDRTSNLTGRGEDLTLAQLKEGNFSYYAFGREKLKAPIYEHLEIPTFEEILQEFRGKAGMNIQVYAKPDGLREICRLYCDYDMFDQGFMTIAELENIEIVKSFDSRIEVCYTPGWKERCDPDNLKLCKEIGCRFVQPPIEHSNEDTYALCRQLGLRTNVFYADTEANIRKILAQGGTGMLSNRADIVLDIVS